MTFEYWFMFPIAAAIATTAMASGVEGAIFFTPLFILVLGLAPEVAIGTGLITAVFGTASGVLAYAQKRLIDYRLGGALLTATIPMGILGAALSPYIYPDVLKAALALILIAVGWSFRTVLAPREPPVETPGATDTGTPIPSRQIITRAGESFRYPKPRLLEGRVITGVGSLFLGLISTGLGQMNGYYLIQRSKIPGKIAVATSVFVVSITAFTASVGHLTRILDGDSATLNTVLSLVTFTIPGVLIGGQIGPMIASLISQRALERGLTVLFVTVALILIIDVIY